MSLADYRHTKHSNDESEEPLQDSTEKCISFSVYPMPSLIAETTHTLKEICRDELENLFTTKDIQ